MTLALLLWALPAFAAIEKAPTALPAVPILAPAAAPQAAVLPEAAAAAPGAPALPVSLAAAPAASIDGRVSDALRVLASRGKPAAAADADALAGERTFDGAGEPRPAPPIQPGWTMDGFTAEDGALLFYKRSGSADKPARVFSGGLALNESFEPLYSSQKEPGNQYFIWTRGHPPTQWSQTRHPLDADARDLARLIVRAAASSRTGKVELVLHSFGTLIFQRLVQLRDEPEAAEALDKISGSRVVLLNATTHYPGSERQAGPEFEQMGTATRAFVDWLDGADDIAGEWEALYKTNPWAYMGVRVALDQWYLQRKKLLAYASKGAADMMRGDLKDPWAAPFDHVRLELAKMLEHDARDKGWQEALLRRSRDMFILNFAPEDVAEIRAKNIRLELVHTTGDKLLNWASARALYARLGIAAPKDMPPAGTTLSDPSGRFRAHILEGDHYFPLKRWHELAKLLDP